MKPTTSHPEARGAEAPRQFLLMMHIGPVQEWIAQARRTRDSWFGSHYLSEISKAAARTLHQGHANLIFPHTFNLEQDLKPFDSPYVETLVFNDQDDSPAPRSPEPTFSVANKIVAVLQCGDTDVEEIAISARAAACRRWQEIVRKALGRTSCQELVDWKRQGTNMDALIAEQRDTLLETYTVWAPLQSEEAYGEVFTRLDAALNARKRVREFSSWTADRAGAYRSSLDGARASILKPIPQANVPSRQARALARLRIPRGEHLDTVGLARRAGGAPEQLIPLINVACAAWIQEAHRRCPEQLRKLKDACDTLSCSGQGFGTIWRKPESHSGQWVCRFPYDAHLFFEERWSNLFEELNESREESKRISPEQALTWCKQFVVPVLERMPQPPRYVACIVADGDNMGKTLSRLNEARHHQAFSGELSRFAGVARKIVERNHLGSLVFSGGDDVLGWVPVETSAECASELKDAFNKILAPLIEKMRERTGDVSIPVPTLSVGIGIGHVMEAMGSLIQLGRDAEKSAKGDALPATLHRNALAIFFEKRSGGPLEWRAGWNSLPVRRLQQDIELLAGERLSVGKLHQVQAMIDRLPAPDAVAPGEDAGFNYLLQQEFARIMARNEGRGGRGARPVPLTELGLDWKATQPYKRSHTMAGETIDRLLIAWNIHRLKVNRRGPADADSTRQASQSDSPSRSGGAK